MVKVVDPLIITPHNPNLHDVPLLTFGQGLPRGDTGAAVSSRAFLTSRERRQRLSRESLLRVPALHRRLYSGRS